MSLHELPTAQRERYSPISSYALIGNARTAALISRAGSIDRLCLPHFDGEFPFGAILDADAGGYFQICPADEFTVERRYLPETNVLETTFRTSAGACVLRDLFTIGGEGQSVLETEHELLREVEGLDGTVVLNVSYEPRRDYARATVRLEARGPFGLACEAAGGLLSLISDVALRTEGEGTRAAGRATIEAGQRRYWSLIYNSEAPAASALLGEAARKRVDDTAEWWRAWASRCTYEGPYREHVVRSALVLKLLTFAPSGAIVAAPTTSLPERTGGDRNWDYRYCWLRDAAFTVRALVQLGYHEEAEAFAAWMTHATALTHPRLQVLYDVFGESKIQERTLDHLDGYQGSRPVRIGNGAHSQLQLDVYGEVTKSFRYCSEAGLAITYTAEGFLRDLGDAVCRLWREPDHGFWERRGAPSRHRSRWRSVQPRSMTSWRFTMQEPSRRRASSTGAWPTPFERRWSPVASTTRWEAIRTLSTGGSRCEPAHASALRIHPGRRRPHALNAREDQGAAFGRRPVLQARTEG